MKFTLAIMLTLGVFFFESPIGWLVTLVLRCLLEIIIPLKVVTVNVTSFEIAEEQTLLPPVAIAR